MEQIDIKTIDLIIGFIALVIPSIIFLKYKTELFKPLLIAFLRMSGQLILVGLYLEYIFEWNNIFINILWVIIMIVVATFLITKRSEINNRTFFFPVLFSVLTGFLFNTAIFSLLIIGLEDFFNARYIIPIAGMLIGNSITASIMGLRSFFNNLTDDNEKYQYYLMTGATKKEALFDFIKKSLQDAFNPVIASTATIGLIWLPGMMTGQILGGSNPITAIKYQIIIVIAIFVSSVINVILCINISKRLIFDNRDMIDLNKIEKK